MGSAGKCVREFRTERAKPLARRSRNIISATISLAETINPLSNRKFALLSSQASEAAPRFCLEYCENSKKIKLDLIITRVTNRFVTRVTKGVSARVYPSF
jgi:hypothetical protein